MTAEDHVREGRLAEALAELQGAIRKQPADPRLRIFLFQLLAVLGQWERALTQLKVAADLDPAAVEMLQAYQEALRCEMLRAEIFAGRQAPVVFGKPDEWMALLVEAARLVGHGKFDEASRLRGRALELAPPTSGNADGQPFEWIADADSRLGPVLEAIVNGRYYWIPFVRLSAIRIEKPVDLRDLVWTPAELTLANGGEVVALLPTRYPGSESAGDARLALARSTDWVEHPGDWFLGRGQRLLATDQGDLALLELREISLGSGPEASDPTLFNPDGDVQTPRAPG